MQLKIDIALNLIHFLTEISSQMRSASRTIYRAIEQIPGIKIPQGARISFEGRKIAVDQEGSLFPFVQYWQLIFVLEPYNVVQPVTDNEWLKEITRYVKHKKLKPKVLATAGAAVAAVRAAQQAEEEKKQQGRLSVDGRKSVDVRKSVDGRKSVDVQKSVDGRRLSISSSSGAPKAFHFSAENVHQSEVRAVRIHDPLNTMRLTPSSNGPEVIAVTPRPSWKKILIRRSSTSIDNNIKN